VDPGESIFKGLLRVWHRLRGEPERPEPGAALLDTEEERVEMLATLLFGEPVDVKPAEGAGGAVGTSLLLPRQVRLFDREEDNAAVYRYRAAVAAVARSVGLDRVGGSGDARIGALASLLAMPAVLAEMHDRYPGTRPLTERFATTELAARRATGDPSDETVGGIIEILARELVARASGLDPAAAADRREVVEEWLARARRTSTADATAVDQQARALWKRLCQIADQRREGPVEITIWGRFWPPSEAEREEETFDEALERSKGPGADHVVQLDRTIRLRRQRLGRREDKPLFHVFEKLETAEDFAGQSATPDGSGNVESMRDALDELSLGTAVRTAETPENLVRAEVIVDPAGVDVTGRVRAVDERVFRYPEWNHKKGEYREDWCTLVEERLVAGEGAAINAAASREILRGQRRYVEDIRGHLMRALRRQELRTRQTDGPEIDINAMVERHADLVAGSTPTDRLYRGPKRALRDVAVLILLDTSYSTDAWLQGRRVLDVGMESLLILSAALEGLIEEEVAVATFRSKTRHDVRFGVLKSFDDPWAQLRRTAPGVEPEGYTRIGAAVRHATAILDEASARKKLLLILSDGKPTDYDRYEGRHGIEDVGRAVREANQRRVKTFGLAIEQEAKLYLARMLGRGSYRILPRTSLLPEVMAEVFLGMLTD
jgi:nitric oxide reductase activation protein